MVAVDCDVAVVGAGPAGSVAAVALLRAEPGLRVALLDAADFPRDKVCGDGIGPQVVDRLTELGLRDVIDGWTSLRRFDIRYGAAAVRRSLTRPMWVIPRRVFDARLVEAATARGARLLHHRVRELRWARNEVNLDGHVRARVVIGADGAHSVVRAAVGAPSSSRRALALRGYAAVPSEGRGVQRIVFSGRRHPSYAWSFDRGDGLANVGYGELLDPRTRPPTRASMLTRLEQLLPGAVESGSGWRGHHLPLSSWRFSHPQGRVLLAGDAAGLVNPVTGEGIYYAVRTGMLAGAVAAAALAADDAPSAGRRYHQAVRAALAGHLKHVAAAAWLFGRPVLMEAGLRAAANDQRVFDDLMDMGLAQGKLTAPVLRALTRSGLTRRGPG
jgi:geranylgeranyl reductase family protein